MPVNTIEDCLEHLVGYHARMDDLPYDLHEDNVKVIRSVAKQVYKGKALTEKQFYMCNKILQDYYVTEFHKNGIDITEAVRKVGTVEGYDCCLTLVEKSYLKKGELVNTLYKIINADGSQRQNILDEFLQT